jgi:hypothetical protein
MGFDVFFSRCNASMWKEICLYSRVVVRGRVLLKSSVEKLKLRVVKDVVLNFMHVDLQYGSRSLVPFVDHSMTQALSQCCVTTQA